MHLRRTTGIGVANPFDPPGDGDAGPDSEIPTFVKVSDPLPDRPVSSPSGRSVLPTGFTRRSRLPAWLSERRVGSSSS